jgi:nucleolar protein 4
MASEDMQDYPSKKARKETNAGARRTLFVRSLPAIATSEALTKLFSESYPLKHATVVLDTETKQSKGYGFVTFADAEDAQKAADEFNGKIFLGRRMKIEIAQPRSREIVAKDGMEGKRKSTISAEAAAIKKAREEKMAEAKKPPKLIIRNLPWSVKTPEQLEAMFLKFGKVKHSTLPKVKDKQAGFGFVVMRGRKNAEKALATINGTTVDGRQLAVDWAVEKEVWEGQSKSTGAEDAALDDDEDGGAKLSDEEEPDEEDDVKNFMKNFGDQLESEEEDEENEEQDENSDDAEVDEDDKDGFSDVEDEELSEEEPEEQKPPKILITDNSTTLFIRNLPFTTLDPDLKEHFSQFGPVRYARVVIDRATDRPKGTGFVCFFNVEDADNCFRGAPRFQPSGANATKKADAASKAKHSLLQDEGADSSGMYTIEGRVLQISKAVGKEKAVKLTEEGTNFRTDRDKDKRKLYLLSEGTVASGTPLYEMLAPSEIKMREDSAMQRKKLIQNNPTLHLSLTRLSIRNLPRNINSKDLKALSREAVVGFAKDVKAGKRAQLSKEEEARGGDEMREAEKQRKAKGKGIVRQAKIVFEGREGAKVSEDSGAGRSRGYGFVEYSSHHWALMGLRWLNGHALENASGKKQRLIVEFAIENAQVVQRRKEREEKARVRSKEVLEARERGELPEKEGKKVLSKNTIMAKTRKGMKGKKGRPEEGVKKSFDRVPQKVADGGKRKRDGDDEKPKGKKFQKGAKGDKKPAGGSKSKVTEPEVDEKQSKRAQIIQKKRMARRNRRQGHA